MSFYAIVGITLLIGFSILLLIYLGYLGVVGVRLIRYWFRRTDMYYWLYRHGAFKMSCLEKNAYEELRKNIWDERQLASLVYIPNYLGDNRQWFWVNAKDYKRFKKGELTVSELHSLAVKGGF